MDYKPGDIIEIKVNGKVYKTIIDENGIQRFPQNTVIEHLFYSDQLDLNRLSEDYQNGKFSKLDYAEFMMSGYSILGFSDLSAFQDWEIENPLWEE